MIPKAELLIHSSVIIYSFCFFLRSHERSSPVCHSKEIFAEALTPSLILLDEFLWALCDCQHPIQDKITVKWECSLNRQHCSWFWSSETRSNTTEDVKLFVRVCVSCLLFLSLSFPPVREGWWHLLFLHRQALGWLVLLFLWVEEFYSYNERLFVLPWDLVVKMETREGLRYDRYMCVWYFCISENNLVSLEIILIWLPII